MSELQPQLQLELPLGAKRCSTVCPQCGGFKSSRVDARCHKCRGWKRHVEHGSRSMYVKGCRCDPCVEASRVYARKRHSPEETRAKRLKYERGITTEQFAEMLAAQCHVCAICKGNDWRGRGNCPVVDHDHATGKIRGLLCNNCNRSLGLLKDNIEVLESAVAYLQQHQAQKPS